MSLSGLDKIGINQNLNFYRNLSMERLIQEGLLNGDTKMAMNGAVMVDTGIVRSNYILYYC